MLKNQWQVLTGKLEEEIIEAATYGIAVKYNNGLTAIKTVTKDLLAQFDMSTLISHYQILR